MKVGMSVSRGHVLAMQIWAEKWTGEQWTGRFFSVCHRATAKYYFFSCSLFLGFQCTTIFLARLRLGHHIFYVTNFAAFFVSSAGIIYGQPQSPLCSSVLCDTTNVLYEERQELNITGSWTEGFMTLLSRHLQGSILHRSCEKYLKPLTEMLILILKNTHSKNRSDRLQCELGLLLVSPCKYA